MDCPRCESIDDCKAGILRGNQRYRCKSCKYHYTVVKRRNEKSEETKKLALPMYLEGLGFRAIGRLLEISYGTVYQWVRKYGQEQSLPQSHKPVQVMELDELHTYVGSKKTTSGYGLLLIDWQKG